jgi:hypothetical protein
MSPKDLGRSNAKEIDARQQQTANTGIVSIRALSYTERAALSLQSKIEVVDLCIPKPCANRADGD